MQRCKGAWLEAFWKLYSMFRFFFLNVLIINNKEALQTQKINHLVNLEMGCSHGTGSVSVMLLQVLFVALQTIAYQLKINVFFI